MKTNRRRGRGGRSGHEPRVRIRQREQDVIQLTAEGRSQHDIAQLLGITQPAVSQILRRVDERWLRENVDRVAQYKAEQTRKLEHIWREAMKSWEQSKSQRTRRRQRKTTGGTGNDGGAIAEVIVDDSYGDPRYLEAARKALADIARLWGTPNTYSGSAASDDTPAVITLTIGDERTAPNFEGKKGI